MGKKKLHSGSNQHDAGEKDHRQSIFSLANKGHIYRDDIVQLLSVVTNPLLRDPISVLHFLMHVVVQSL